MENQTLVQKICPTTTMGRVKESAFLAAEEA